MIERIKGKFYLYCDICGDKTDDEFDTFDDAVNGKRENGFKSSVFRIDGQEDIWQDACVECQE